MLPRFLRMPQLSSTKPDAVAILLRKRGQRDDKTCVRSVPQQVPSGDERVQQPYPISPECWAPSSRARPV